MTQTQSAKSPSGIVKQQMQRLFLRGVFERQVANICLWFVRRSVCERRRHSLTTNGKDVCLEVWTNARWRSFWLEGFVLENLRRSGWLSEGQMALPSPLTEWDNGRLEGRSSMSLTATSLVWGSRVHVGHVTARCSAQEDVFDRAIDTHTMHHRKTKTSPAPPPFLVYINVCVNPIHTQFCTWGCFF